MTDAELSILLARFLGLPAGTEVVEFKQSGKDFDFEQFGRYFSALSNEANLRGHGAAWLVLEVNDDREQGFDFYPDPTSLTAFEDRVAARVGSDLKIRQIYKLPKAEGKTILFFEVPPALQGIPTSWEGCCYTRNGEKLDVLSFDKLEAIRGQAHRRPFEEDIALAGQTSDQVLALLDGDKVFNLFNLPVSANKSSVLDRLQQERLLSHNGSHYDITNLGGLLFARNLMAFPGLANKAVRVIFYADSSRLKPIFEQTWNEGYALAFEKIGPYIDSNLPDNRGAKNVAGSVVTPVYSELALSELIANALIHQNFIVTSSPPLVEVFDDRIEVSSLGRPLVDTNRFLDYPLRSRNKTLTGIMRRLNFCEERGSGIDKVIAECEEHRLPPPEFRVGENSTRAVLYSPQDFDKMCQEDKIRACYQHASLKYMSGEFMTCQSLCERLNIKNANFRVTLRVIAYTIAAGFVQPCDPEKKSRKHAMYQPFWA